MNPRPPVSTAETKPSLTDCALPKSTTQGDCAGAGIPGSKGRKYPPEEIRKRLLELGGRDATLDPTVPNEFDFSASGITPQKQGLTLGFEDFRIRRLGAKSTPPITKMNTTTPQTQQMVNADSSSKALRRDFALAEQAPPDHWIYTQGAQCGFVGALPKSRVDSQAKKVQF